jgi:hypothetical protein
MKFKHFIYNFKNIILMKIQLIKRLEIIFINKKFNSNNGDI